MLILFVHLPVAERKHSPCARLRRRRLLPGLVLFAPWMSDSKLCTCCGKRKALSQFARNTKAADGRCYRCKECGHQYYLANKARIQGRSKRWSHSHPEHVKARNQQYYDLHGEELRERSAAYHGRNLEACRQRQKEYYRAHREELCAYQVAYRQANLPRIREYKRNRLASDPEKRRRQNECNRNYAHAHPGVVRRGNLTRSQREKLAAAGAYTREQVEQLFTIVDWCLWCERHAWETPEG